ncbi:MAG: hypothetical protein O9327_01985 [Polaromonas sp.]|nr:hypothetical protein [Polaromonas sp.]
MTAIPSYRTAEPGRMRRVLARHSALSRAVARFEARLKEIQALDGSLLDMSPQGKRALTRVQRALTRARRDLAALPGPEAAQ